MKIFPQEDILPKLKSNTILIKEDDIQRIVEDSLKGQLADECIFLEKINVIFVIYNNYKKSRLIYVIEEISDIQDFGDLSLENLSNFSLDSIAIKELRNEDFNSVSEGVETLSKIVIDNNKE
jgi:hypothetical protein